MECNPWVSNIECSVFDVTDGRIAEDLQHLTGNWEINWALLAQDTAAEDRQRRHGNSILNMLKAE